MSGNYDQLHDKANDVVEATTNLRQKKSVLLIAEKEIAQSQKALDTVTADFEKRKAQCETAESEKTTFTTEVSTLRAARTDLESKKAAAITERDNLRTELTDKNAEIAAILGEPSPTATPAAAPTITPTAQATAPGMNPPHGQPGHRCDIPVGSPLNSKPPQATITPGTTTPKADTAKNR